MMVDTKVSTIILHYRVKLGKVGSRGSLRGRGISPQVKSHGSDKLIGRRSFKRPTFLVRGKDLFISQFKNFVYSPFNTSEHSRGTPISRLTLNIGTDHFQVGCVRKCSTNKIDSIAETGKFFWRQMGIKIEDSAADSVHGIIPFSKNDSNI